MSGELVTKIAGVNLEIDKEDLLAIGVANYEQKLITRKRELEKVIRDEQAFQAKKRKELGTKLQAFGDAIETSAVKKFVDAAKSFGLEVQVEARATIKDGNIEATKVVKACKIVGRNDAVRLRTLTEKYPVSGTVEMLVDVIENSVHVQREANAELREVMIDLQNLATKEREVRAHLALQSLQATEEGRAVLQALQTGDNPFMLEDKGDV